MGCVWWRAAGFRLLPKVLSIHRVLSLVSRERGFVRVLQWCLSVVYWCCRIVFYKETSCGVVYCVVKQKRVYSLVDCFLLFRGCFGGVGLLSEAGAFIKVVESDVKRGCRLQSAWGFVNSNGMVRSNNASYLIECVVVKAYFVDWKWYVFWHGLTGLAIVGL